jgi:hypothetical protein
VEQFVMEFLNVEPLIAALRMRPAEFEKDGNWVRHLPSDHRFKVDGDGNVNIDASCDCALLHVSRRQGKQLLRALSIWEAAYWRPVEINKEFASHFASRGLWQRIYRKLSSSSLAAG